MTTALLKGPDHPIAQTLRQRRAALNLQQIEVAAMAGLSAVQLHRLEQGRFILVHPERLVALAKVLGLSLDTMLGMDRPDAEG